MSRPSASATFEAVGPPSVSARAALAVVETGWCSANHWSGSSIGSRSAGS
jgi:hypothetical protein